MKYLIDTHVWLWWLQNSPKLSREARDLLMDRNNTLYVSAVSLWEIRIKQQNGKISLPENFGDIIKNQSDFIELPVLFEHVNTLLRFPFYHQDPFDRLLIAQAFYENLVFVSRDKLLEQYQIPMVLLH